MDVQLRAWQSESINLAMARYTCGHSDFLCLATPGAGKTLMASRLAKSMLDEDLIDLVVCFSPSRMVATDFQKELGHHTGLRFDGLLGASGASLTYQTMLFLSDQFWQLIETNRTLVIFDEIHHCAGSSQFNANSWGEKILTKLQGKAAYSLALTGTPWRSDNVPIVLTRYSEQNRVICDYSYGLKASIRDKVCRVPRIIGIDNSDLSLEKGDQQFHFTSIQALVRHSRSHYQALINNEELLKYTLSLACNRLEQERSIVPSSGGLIVAASVAHALKIKRILDVELNVESELVTHQQSDAQIRIELFRNSDAPWIISVGMISEGTNIPRLKVCCYLTRVKTELYFRQVLGRVLRSDGSDDDCGYLYMPAEPDLMEYARRVADDIPEACVIDVVDIQEQSVVFENSEPHERPITETVSGSLRMEGGLKIGSSDRRELINIGSTSTSLDQLYDASLNVFGRFREDVLSLHDM